MDDKDKMNEILRKIDRLTVFVTALVDAVASGNSPGSRTANAVLIDNLDEDIMEDYYSKTAVPRLRAMLLEKLGFEPETCISKALSGEPVVEDGGSNPSTGEAN